LNLEDLPPEQLMTIKLRNNFKQGSAWLDKLRTTYLRHQT